MRSIGLLKAISLAGSQAALAKALRSIDPKVSQQHISYWLTHGIPARRVGQVLYVLPDAGQFGDFYVSALHRNSDASDGCNESLPEDEQTPPADSARTTH